MSTSPFKKLESLSPKDKIKFLRGYLPEYKKYDLRKNGGKIHGNTLRKVERDIDVIHSMNAVPHPIIYSPKSKKNKQYARDYLHLPKRWNKFVMNVAPDEKIIIRDNQIMIDSLYITKSRYMFNMYNISTDNEENTIKEIEKGVNSRRYKFEKTNLICGDALLGGIKTPADFGSSDSTILVNELNDKINVLKEKYSNQQSNHYYENWLLGLEFRDFKNQKGNAVKKKKRITYKQFKNR